MAGSVVGYKTIYPTDLAHFNIKEPECVEITLRIFVENEAEHKVTLALAEEMKKHEVELALLVEMRVREDGDG